MWIIEVHHIEKATDHIADKELMKRLETLKVKTDYTYINASVISKPFNYQC